MSTVTPVQATVPASLPHFLSELYDSGITVDQLTDVLDKLIKKEISDPDEAAKLGELLDKVKADYSSILGTAKATAQTSPVLPPISIGSTSIPSRMTFPTPSKVRFAVSIFTDS